MQKQRIILIVGILILTAVGSLYLIVKSKSAQIATFEECVKAGWLMRSRSVYDGFGLVGSIEEECVLWSGKSFEKKQQNNNQQTSAKQNWESKTDGQLAVTVTVTPTDISPQSKEWKFNVVMDTHSVELDQDMIKSAVLIDEKGKEYKPTTWEGSVGGHHREGVLIFNQITPTPISVELKISGIGDVIRNFTWQLK